MRRSLCLLSLAYLLPFSADASVAFSDDFSYPDGPLVAVSEGRWKTHSGTAGQVTVGNGEVHLSQKQTEDVSAAFAGGPIGPLQSPALYASFEVSFSALPTGADGTYFAHFKDATATTGIRCRVFATTNGASDGMFRVGIAAAANAATAFLPDDWRIGNRYRLVCRILLADNASTLWMDPTAETDSSVTSTDSAVRKSVAGFALRQSLASGNGMGELTIDNVVVATTFAELRPVSAPVIVKTPDDQTVPIGSDAKFQIEAAGTEPLSYRWLFNGTELPGALGAILELRNVTVDQAGTYQVEVSNAAGSVTSPGMTLTIDSTALVLRIAPSGPAGLQLLWAAEPGQSYSVWVTDDITAGFVLLTSDLFFDDGAGSFETATAPGSSQQFYRVCTP